MSGPAATALLPLAAALLALLAAAITGFDQRVPLAPEIDARFYGFFLDRYPLFAFALVYGMTRLLVAAASPSPASLARRAIGCLAAIALLLAASLHPTFGGLVLRAGFATGGVIFLAEQPMAVAYALGSGVAALAFGLALGLGGLMIGGRPRGLGWRLGGALILARHLTLWLAFAVLGLAHSAGFGPWPRRPLTAVEAGVAAALILAAFLPHAILAARSAAQEMWRERPD